MARKAEKNIDSNIEVKEIDSKNEIEETSINDSYNGLITIISENRKNKKVFGLYGEEIIFDENGKARLNKVQADYFLTLPDVKKG